MSQLNIFIVVQFREVISVTFCTFVGKLCHATYVMRLRDTNIDGFTLPSH